MTILMMVKLSLVKIVAIFYTFTAILSGTCCGSADIAVTGSVDHERVANDLVPRNISGSLPRMRRQRRAARCVPDLVEPIVIFPHQRVRIGCSKCSPRSAMSGTTWRFQAYSATNDETLTSKLQSKLGIKIGEGKGAGNDLFIKEASSANAGRYYCKSGAKYLGNYDVTYVSHPQFHIVIPGDKTNDYKPLPETRSNVTNKVMMYTEWEPWSTCNHCGQSGERVRIGLCYARTRLREFPAGVPCRSNVVPYGERSKYGYAQRWDEKMLGTCNIPCPPKAKPSRTGKLIRTFALTEGLPTLPELVKRRVYYENIGDDAELVCPEVGVTHGVRWMNGSSALKQMDLASSSGRFLIDHLSRLVVRDVRPADAGNFTCWFENEKIAVVILKVVKPPRLDEEAEGNAMYVGMVLVFLVVFYIVFGVCRNRRLQTIQ